MRAVKAGLTAPWGRRYEVGEEESEGRLTRATED